MAATSSKVGPFKWYILHRNHLIALYLLAIYLTISLVVLYDFEPIFFAIPTLLIVLLLRVAWDQSNQILSAVGIFILGFILVSFFTSTVQTKEQRSLQLLYNYEQFKNITQLNPKIAKQGENFPSEFNVFFIETNPRREEFSSKQLCAIESAAKNNRNGHIYVLSIRSQLERQLKPLTDLYPNIILMKFMPIELFRDTPLFSWWQSGLVFKSKYSLAHISDAARLALLWKYGGIYSDLDTITIKSFEPLIEKSGVGYIYENVDSIGNGVMVFKRNHDFLMKIMHEFAANYNPYDWGANGPSMILKAIKAYCHVENVRELLDNASLCDDELSIFPEEAFYPLRYIDDEYKALFDVDPPRVVDLLRKFTSSYSVHYYGFKSKDIKVSTRQNTLFGYLASYNCEFMYRHVDSNKLRFE